MSILLIFLLSLLIGIAFKAKEGLGWAVVTILFFIIVILYTMVIAS